ncbi:hypothetical protein O3M35_004229 [Rhynocoris fuscipes]|uniref:PUM-HD domain-containing protein n=1 Tax=Rhynocoris fuscipes TaxID=488301 RepID=A0AAW1CGK8_9HEMI
MQNKIRNKLGKKDRPVRIKKDLKIKDKKNDEGDGKKVKRYRDPLLNTSLKLYEKANKLQSHDEKFKVVQKLVTLLSGKINSIIFRHDMSRVVQLIFKYALPQHKTKIVNEMLSSIQLIASRKYSNHLIKSAMIHCDSSIRNLLIKELQKHTLPILRTKIGVKVLELVYKKYCNNAQRNKFKSSLIGIATVDGSSSLKQQCQVDKALTSAIMSSTKSNLNSLLQKDCCLKSSIVTSALHDYLHSCAENDKIEIKEILLPNIIDLVSTKFGSYCALEIMWICSTKEKKSIIKQLQEVCVDLSLDENGSFFILSLFDCVDDTVLLYKIILSKLMDNIRKILENDWGLRIIDYMFLHHMASNKFSLSDKEILQQSVNAGNTKKDPNTTSK